MGRRDRRRQHHGEELILVAFAHVEATDEDAWTPMPEPIASGQKRSR